MIELLTITLCLLAAAFAFASVGWMTACNITEDLPRKAWTYPAINFILGCALVALVVVYWMEAFS